MAKNMGKVWYSPRETGWIKNVKYEGNHVVGVLANQPITRRLKYGDKVRLVWRGTKAKGMYHVVGKATAKKRVSNPYNIYKGLNIGVGGR